MCGSALPCPPARSRFAPPPPPPVADETYLERAAKVVTNAVVEVIQVVQPALAEDATKRLNKAGRAVGAGYNKLLEVCLFCLLACFACLFCLLVLLACFVA